MATRPTQNAIQAELQHNLNQIEKTFSSNFLTDVVPMITNCSNFMRDYPFPSFIMDVIYRLAKMFQGDAYTKMDQHLNVIRLRIILTTNECKSILKNIAASTEAIVKEIMKVSHSNDYKARSLTLLFLGTLAPIIYENKKVHHLLIESLDCSHHSEKISAIYACSEIVKYSRTFSTMVVDKLGDMLKSSQDSQSLKLNLLNVLSNLDRDESSSMDQLHALETPERRMLDQRLLAMYNIVKSRRCDSDTAISIVKILTSSDSVLGSTSDVVLGILIDICDSYPECSTFLGSWSTETLELKFSTTKPPINLLKLIVKTIDDNDPTSSVNSVTNFLAKLQFINLDYWDVYQVSRQALQTGTSKSIALPLLKRIQNKCDSIETNLWLEALIYVANSQPSDSSVAALKVAEDNIREAAMILKILKSLNHGCNQHFGFAHEYIECFISTLGAFKCVLMTLNVKFLSYPFLMNQKSAINENCRLNITKSLMSSVERFTSSSQRWARLYSRSFDSGFQTLKQIELMIRLNEFVVRLISGMIDPFSKIKSQQIRPTTLHTTNSTIHKISALISSVEEEVSNLFEQHDAFAQRIHLFKSALERLCTFPMQLPQYFFTKRWSTKIRLNLQPQPTESEGSLRVSSSDLVPITIEGIIDTNNPNYISEVTVILSKNNAQKEERKIALEKNERYFKTLFALRVVKVTKIRISVSFTDSFTKKVWRDDSDNVVSIVITPTDV